MKRNLQKLLALVLSAVLVCVTFSGCMSPLASALEAERKAREVKPLDLKEIFNEEQGFHFPGLQWDMDVTAVREKTQAPITTIIGYSEGGEVAYNANGMRMSVFDQVNDQTAVTVTKDGIVYLISLIYYQDGSNAGRTMGLEEIYNGLQKELTQAYGEASALTDDHEVNGTKTVTESLEWTYSLKDMRVTHLQLAKTTVGDAKEPGYISLGFVIDTGVMKE